MVVKIDHEFVFIGRCRVSDKMLTLGDTNQVLRAAGQEEQRIIELFCKCHDSFVVATQTVDVIEEREPGEWYWVLRGP